MHPQSAGIYQRGAARVTIVARMRSNDAQDSFGDDFEPAQLMIGPDGGIDGGVQDAPVIRPPPRLCEAGPCVNYHRFAVQLEVEGPKAQSVEPGGKLVGKPPPAPFYVRVHHYCYPTVGVETELEGLPVTQCNRWEPKGASDTSLVELRRKTFLQSEDGQRYTADLAAWQAEREAAEAAAVASDDGELAAWIAMHMRDGDELEIRTSTAPVGQDPAFVFDATGARDFNPDNLAPGTYRAWITRNATNVTFKDFEVPHVHG